MTGVQTCALPILEIIKEMYRVSRNGAVWEIQTPHWRSDNYLNDPTHIRPITAQMMELFNKKHIIWTIKEGLSHSHLAFDLDIDIEICDVKYEFTHLIKEKLESKEMSQEELYLAFNTMNNIAESTKMLIEVHKPGRYDLKDLQNAIEDRNR